MVRWLNWSVVRSDGRSLCRPVGGLDYLAALAGCGWEAAGEKYNNSNTNIFTINMQH